MAIIGIIGAPGAGKSLEAARRAKIAHDRRRFHVYTNTPVNLASSTLVTPSTLAQATTDGCDCKRRCKGKFVLLDEVHLWLPARRSLQLPVSWLSLFSQTRKIGWAEVVYTAQHETRVDRVLRDVSTYMVLAEHFTLPWEWFRYTTWEPEYFRNPSKRLTRDVRRRSRSASDVYDTLAKIAGADHFHDKNDPYAARATGTTNERSS